MTVRELKNRQQVFWIYPALQLFREQLEEIKNIYQLQNLQCSVRGQQEKLLSERYSEKGVWFNQTIERDLRSLQEFQVEIQQLSIQFNLGKEQFFSVMELEKYICSCTTVEQLTHLSKYLPHIKTDQGVVLDTTTELFHIWEESIERLMGTKRPPRPSWFKSLHENT